jgi:hypothetical protein
MWDPDGAGPLPEELVVGGAFVSVDGVVANAIAAWDGRQWTALGTQISAPSPSNDGGVTSLAVHNGELYAAGFFVLAPSTSQVPQVAKWNGTAWVPVGTPFSSGTVNALASFNGNLYVGGRFTLTGGAHIAKLVGNSWMGLGFGSIESGTRVDSLAVQGNSLLVGGYFTQNLVRIDANGARSPVGSPPFSFSVGGSIGSIWVDGANVYVAGDFRLSNNSQPGVMHFDGTTWTPMVAPTTSGRRRVVGFNSAIYLSPGLTNSPNALLRWGGAAWTAVNPSESFIASGSVDVAALGVFQNHLILGGSFAGLTHPSTATDIPRLLFSLAQLATDESVAPISRGLGARVSSFTEFQGRPVVSGRFTSVGPTGGGPLAVGEPGRLAQLDDNGFWVPFAGGLPDNNIWASAVYGGQLIVGGESFNVGGVSNAVAAAWDGAAWHDMSAGALNFPVVMRVAGNDLWGGFVTTPEVAATLAVGRWDGAHWNMIPGTAGYSGLTAIGTEFYVTREDGQSVARWNGAAFETLPLPPSETDIRVVGQFQGDLVAISGGLRMYRWDGSAWTSAGMGPTAGLPSTSSLGNAVESHGVMYVGTNRPMNQTGSEEILSWDGSAWGSFGRMLFNPGYSINITFAASSRPPSLLNHGPDEVFVGGTFVSIRYRGTTTDDAAANFVRMITPERLVTLAAPPVSLSKIEGESLQLDWALSSPAATYSWRKNGVTLVDGTVAGVGTVSGSRSASLHIENVGRGAAGLYSCTANDTCQTITLTSTLVTIGLRCDPDMNADGNVDQGDIDYLINIIAGGDNPENRDADFNLDGNADASDVDALINVVAGGGCP